MKRTKKLNEAVVESVDVEPFDRESPTSGIQEAITAMGKHGGRLHLPAGTYSLHRPIFLPDNITLCGDGAATILTAPQPQSVELAADARAGQRSIVCKPSVAPFGPGDIIGIFDDQRRANHGTHATVLEVRGPRMKLDAPIHMSLKTAAHARAVRLSPLIVAKNREGFRIDSLTIQGSGGYQGPGYDFTFAAISLVDCREMQVTNCRVLDWPSDGISIQGGSDAQVTNCQTHRCRGHGLHPGTNLGRSVWSHNISTHNGADGFFFCAGVHHSVCANNVLNFNGRGIGGVGNGNDHHNVISSNIIAGNQRMGISATDGEEHTISGNIVMNNSQRKAGEFPGILLANFRRGIIQGNRLADDQKKKTQWTGIHETGTSDHNLVTGNFCLDMRQGFILMGPNSVGEGNVL